MRNKAFCSMLPVFVVCACISTLYAQNAAAQMQEASDWTLKRFHDYGIDGHLETAQIAHAWVRGNDTAEITAPVKRSVGIHAAGMEPVYRRAGQRACHRPWRCRITRGKAISN